MFRNAIYIIWCVAALLTSCNGVGGGSVAEGQQQTVLPETSPKGRVRLLFAGDAMCHTPQFVAARCSDGSFDFRESFAAVKPYFERADVVVVNLETTLSPDSRYSGYPNFSSPVEYAEALAWAGADVALLANNHCCDRGAKGLRSTVASLDRLGIAHTGAFADSLDYERCRVLRIEQEGVHIALVNYTYGTNGIATPHGCVVNMIDTVQMAADLRIANEGSDCVVACMHWGEEYSRTPSREQHRLADFLHRHGADIVVGSHPHVVQRAEATERSVTIYSLGNFVSNQRKRYCDGGLIAEVEVVKEAEDAPCRLSLTITPVWVALPGYRILPPEVAAQESMNTAQRVLYEQFMYDTELLFVQGAKNKSSVEI